MPWEWVAFAAAAAAVLSIVWACAVVGQAQKQIAAMADILADVKSGNGNRRILAQPHDLTAPLAYGINDVILEYEGRLAVLHRADEANRQLMTSLSHDVRTPLTTLIGYLDAAHRGIVTGRERDEYLETARRKAHDLKEYIDALFDWFRLNSDEFTLEMKRIEAGELTRNILIDWVPVLEDKGIGYRVEIPEEPFWVQADGDAYRRILNNLIQNAVSHSQASLIELALTKEHGAMRLLVADNGVGIGEEDRRHIFERLYKCDKGRAEKGSGLGLAITRQLAEKMNGAVTVASEPGQGAAFTLLFPLAE